MRTLATIGLMLSLMIFVASDALAQGRGGGGQRGMRGGSAASQNRNGAQSGAMQRQMMQNRYRMMQSGMGNQMGYGQQNGMGQQLRLRDGSCGAQGDAGAIDPTQVQTMQMMQQRMRQGQPGFGNTENGQGAAKGMGRGSQR
ncbi:MAG: hypothetical protein ACYC6N_19485 [Pirellulaceae bacterium]